MVKVFTLKVTDVPAQNIDWEEVIDTVGVSKGFTVIVIILLVAIAGTGQVALEVISTLTWLPFINAVVVKVGLFVPTATPLTYH